MTMSYGGGGGGYGGGGGGGGARDRGYGNTNGSSGGYVQNLFYRGDASKLSGVL
jgi:hypothetical protein